MPSAGQIISLPEMVSVRMGILKKEIMNNKKMSEISNNKIAKKGMGGLRKKKVNTFNNARQEAMNTIVLYPSL